MAIVRYFKNGKYIGPKPPPPQTRFVNRWLNQHSTCGWRLQWYQNDPKGIGLIPAPARDGNDPNANILQADLIYDDYTGDLTAKILVTKQTNVDGYRILDKNNVVLYIKQWNDILKDDMWFDVVISQRIINDILTSPTKPVRR